MTHRGRVPRDALEQPALLPGLLARPHLAEVVHRVQALGEAVQRVDQRDDLGAGEQVMVQLRAGRVRGELCVVLKCAGDVLEGLLVELEELRLVNRAYTELTLDGGDEGWALEEGTGEGLEGAWEGGGVGKAVVQAKHADVLLTWDGLSWGNNIDDQHTYLHPAGILQDA